MSEALPDGQNSVRELPTRFHYCRIKLLINSAGEEKDFGEVSFFSDVRVGERVQYWWYEGGQRMRGHTSSVESILPLGDGTFRIITDSGSVFFLTPGAEIVPQQEEEQRPAKDETTKEQAPNRGIQSLIAWIRKRLGK